MKMHNMPFDSESAQIGIPTFSMFSIICSFVTMRCAQIRSARRQAVEKSRESPNFRVLLQQELMT